MYKYNNRYNIKSRFEVRKVANVLYCMAHGAHRYLSSRIDAKRIDSSFLCW